MQMHATEQKPQKPIQQFNQLMFDKGAKSVPGQSTISSTNGERKIVYPQAEL